MAHWFISAGDVSGDIHASGLIREVTRLRPDIAWHGLGGEPLARAGCRLLTKPDKEPVMGFSKVLARLPHYFSLLARIREYLETQRPEAVVLVDFPGLNLRIAALARSLGIPVAYFICPQLWAWAPWRIRRFARLVDLALVILPFEEDYYQHHGVEAQYIGHPICDRKEDDAIEQSFTQMPEGEILGLLPGSRRQELEANLPVMLEAARVIAEQRPETVPVVTHFRPDLLERAQEIALQRGVKIHAMQGGMRRVARSSRLALVCSGTATLEVAFLKTPMVVIYRTTKFLRRFASYLFTAPYFCQVNLMAGEEVVPELALIGDDPHPLLQEALPLVEDTEARTRMLQGLVEFSRQHFHPGAMERAAKLVVQTFLQ